MTRQSEDNEDGDGSDEDEDKDALLYSTPLAMNKIRAIQAQKFNKAEQHKDDSDVHTETLTVTKKCCYGERKASQQRDDSSMLAGTSFTIKKKQATNLPKDPTRATLRYGTAHYTPYDPILKNTGPPNNEPFRSFAQYDRFTLYMNPNVKNLHDIPCEGVRLDDLTAALVLDRFSHKTLNKNWPAEFDIKGMIRGNRVPIGHAAKVWKNEGELDVYGDSVPVDGAGYYYMWWRGIHCLCGKEGLDAGVYKHRPSHEESLSFWHDFKVSSRAIVQLPPGDHADTTFAITRASANID